jgi:hypothetical protein
MEDIQEVLLLVYLTTAKIWLLILGFTGYRRGSYDFYKTDWKYLNDFSTRGGFKDIEGVLVPAGTSTVYDQNAWYRTLRDLSCM